jgi:hypothetical protein
MVTIYQVSGTTWSITLTDTTTGQTYSTEKSYSDSLRQRNGSLKHR